MFGMFRCGAVARVILGAALLTGCDTSSPPPQPVAAAPAPKSFTLDTPISVIAANADGKAVLLHDIPGVMADPHYPEFESMSLSELAALSSGRLTKTTLAQVQADLAKLPATKETGQ